MPEIVFIYPIIRTDFVYESLETLFKYTDKSKFKVIVVDQTLDGFEWGSPRDGIVDMVIRQKNMGFSNAANAGIIHALRWNVPYIAVVNDDTEFMYDGWLEDALEEFKTDPKILAVCPESPRVPMWGYGLDHGKYVDILPYKKNYSLDDIAYLKKGDYDGAEIQSRIDFELPKSFPLTKRGVIDGIAMWLPIFKREAFLELGLFEEKFVWGGGEDYDLLARAYSCAWPIERDVCDPQFDKRMVSTMKAWVWHHWGQSKDIRSELDPRLFANREPWNNLDELYPPEINNGKHVDPWGHYEIDGVRKPFKRIKAIQIDIP